MANFTRKEYEAQQASRRSNQSGDKTLVTVLSQLLKEDGATVVVRFPYHSLDDIIYTSMHVVMDYPGRKFGANVECLEHDCPLCAAGVAKKNRVLLKMLVYTQEGSALETKAAIWDRPAAFADVDLKPLFDEYGDIANRLFKIRRTGVKMETRYNITPIDRDNAIYNSVTCPASFELLETVDPSRILVRSLEKYEEAKAQASGQEVSIPTASDHPTVAQEASVQPKPVEAPIQQPAPQPVQNEPVKTTTARGNRYSF